MRNERQLKECPICGSQKLENRVSFYKSKYHGEIPDIAQTICLDCGEGFLDPESLRKIDSYKSSQMEPVEFNVH